MTYSSRMECVCDYNESEKSIRRNICYLPAKGRSVCWKNVTSVFKKCRLRPYRGHKAAFSRPRSQFFTLRTEPYPVNNNFFGKLNEGEISAQPHTSLCIHIWGFIIQCITNKMCMHNEVWGCAEIFPNFWASKIEVREIKESCLTETFPFL